MPSLHRKAKFALILHPVDMPIFRAYIKHLRPDKTYRDKLLLKLFEWTPSYKVKEWTDYSLGDGDFCDGVMIMVPFLPEMREIKLAKVIEKLEAAFAIARDNGCTVATLGAFNSIIIQGREREYGKKYGLTLTSGNTFTTTVIVKSIEDIARRFGIDLGRSTVAIIGAAGDIGSGCMRYLGQRAKRLQVSSRSLVRLQEFVESCRAGLSCEMEVYDSNHKAIKGARFVIPVTSAYSSLFSIRDFDPGTIVCDGSAPVNVELDGTLREDVFLYRGGVVGLPKALDFGFYVGIPRPMTMFGCMTEGIIQAFHDGLPVSHGRGYISPESIEVYAKFIQSDTGVRLAYTIDEHEYSEEELEHYRDTLRGRMGRRHVPAWVSSLKGVAE